MSLLYFIVPRQKRVLIYTVYQQKIINEKQKTLYPTTFIVNPKEIIKKKQELINFTTEDENLFSIVYIHFDGKLETEINVKCPKYDFHENYND